jgi:LCP family protein required for cell wall assembly
MEKMRDFKNRPGSISGSKPKKKWLKPLLIVIGIFILIGAIVTWKTGKLLGKISTNANLLGSLGHMVPGVNNQLKGEKEGRINILLLAMRGVHDPNGGSLADSSMIVSMDPKDNKISYVSIPRDLLVKDIENDGSSKINAIYAQGNAKGGVTQAIADAEKKYGEVAGVPIHYTIVTNYDAFTAVVDAVGGVPINLSKPFEENAQFNQEGVCDGSFFTVPTGKYENKTKKTHNPLTGAVTGTRVTKSYPLCTPQADALECNGDFKLPAGQQTLNSATALCFARARDNSSDFARAKRQQMILQALKSKALSIGTLADFNKVNGIINGLGNNLSTDLQGWEMKRLYDVFMALDKNNPQVIQRVLDEDPTQGMVYGKSDPNYGDVLVPVGDNFDKINQLIQNTFTAPPQANINVIQ